MQNCPLLCIWAAGWQPLGLLLLEGLAVGALIHGGIDLVGANHDPVQRTVVLVLAVIGTLSHSTFNTLVRMAIHIHFLL